jgi:hypothetical protein
MYIIKKIIGILFYVISVQCTALWLFLLFLVSKTQPKLNVGTQLAKVPRNYQEQNSNDGSY